jgi:transcriptional regulator with XRE-family HTH domain
MPTVAQIKAARALLGWKQTDLARATKLSLPSIKNLERGMASPRASTMRIIEDALTAAGIEFTGTYGVQLRDEVFEMRHFDGDDFVARLTDDVFTVIRDSKDELLIVSIDERQFEQTASKEMDRYRENLQKLGYQERVLIPNGHDFFISPLGSYRWLPKQLIGPVPYFIYGDRFAIIMWKMKRVVVMRNRSVADSFREQFNGLWKIGTPVKEGRG